MSAGPWSDSEANSSSVHQNMAGSALLDPQRDVWTGIDRLERTVRNDLISAFSFFFLNSTPSLEP